MKLFFSRNEEKIKIFSGEGELTEFVTSSHILKDWITEGQEERRWKKESWR